MDNLFKIAQDLKQQDIYLFNLLEYLEWDRNLYFADGENNFNCGTINEITNIYKKIRLIVRRIEKIGGFKIDIESEDK